VTISRRVLVWPLLVVALVAATALALDRMFPPDLARYQARSTEIVDANGRLLRAFTTTDGKWRLKTSVDEVDPTYLALLKAYEDRRFDVHWGIDPLAVLRAASQWAGRGRIVSGASTISMQAARLLDEPRPRGLLTKTIQSARALQLEWRYSKREILAIYLTLAPMGGNLEGVRAASFAYFGKEPLHLTAAEAALLVAIPQSPERRRPDRQAGSAQIGRDRVLVRGLEHGVIDKALFDMAARAPVPRRRLGMPMAAPHLSAWLAGQSPGAIVPTTIRYELQSALAQLVNDERARTTDQAQVALVAIDNRTGGVVAWQGGGDFFGPAGQVDLVRAHRSPGSALKPMIYAMAFDDRSLHPASLVQDVPVRFRDWLPRNFDHAHQGAVTVRYALQQSLNVPAVLALERVGPQRFLSTLRAAGASPGLPSGDTGNSLGMALGSATLSPLEMAGLYSGLANGGLFAPPRVRRDRPKPAPMRLIGPAAAWYVADALADAPLPDGFAALPVALRDRRIAYKTGTSAPGLPATRRTGRSLSGSAMPTARRVQGSSAGWRRCPSCSRPSTACRARTIVHYRRRPMSCAWPRGTTCRRACARCRLRRKPAAVRASPIPRPIRRSSSARARRYRSAPTAAAALCVGWSTAGRSTALNGSPTPSARRVSPWSTIRGARAPSRYGSSGGPERKPDRDKQQDREGDVHDPIGARIAEEARQQRAGQQPGDVHRRDQDREQGDLHRDVERHRLAQQHEAREQRRHRRIALGVDQREAEATHEAGRPALTRFVGEGRCCRDPPRQPYEVESGCCRDDRCRTGHGQDQTHDSAGDDRHDPDHAQQNAREIARHAPRTEGRTRGGKAERRRAGAAGQGQRGEEKTR